MVHFVVVVMHCFTVLLVALSTFGCVNRRNKKPPTTTAETPTSVTKDPPISVKNDVKPTAATPKVEGSDSSKEPQTAAGDEEMAKLIEDKNKISQQIADSTSKREQSGERKDSGEAKPPSRNESSDEKAKGQASEKILKIKKYNGDLEVKPATITWEPKAATQKLKIHNKCALPHIVKLKCSDNSTFKVHPVYGMVKANGDLEVLITQLNPPAKRPNKLVIEVAKMEKNDSKITSDSEKLAEMFQHKELEKDSIIVPLLPK